MIALKKVPFYILGLLVLTLAITTVIEKYHGTEFVQQYIYSSWGFIFLWAGLALSGIFILIKKNIYHKNKISFLFHFSFIIILLGAFLSHTTSIKGYIHLREGIQNSHFINDENKNNEILPFALQLEQFETIYYPGTRAPMDYQSFGKIILKNEFISFHISMNNILSYKGYRFYQSSFDEDMKGSYLAVNYDRIGTPVTYIGYILFGLSFFFLLFSRSGRFRQLLRHLLLQKGTLIFLLFLLIPQYGKSTPTSLSKENAEMFSRILILYNDRVTPMQTLAQDFTLKLTGKTHYKNYSAEQFLTGWIFYPETWKNEPIFKIKHKEITKIIGVPEHSKLVPLSAFFTKNGIYKLTIFQNQHLFSNNQTLLNKEINSIDEKIQLLFMLQNGSLLSLFPHKNKNDLQWYTPTSVLPEEMLEKEKLFIKGIFPLLFETIKNGNKKELENVLEKIIQYQKNNGKESLPSQLQTEVELLYNHIGFSKWLYRINLSLGLIAFFFFWKKLLYPKTTKLTRFITKLFGILLFCSFLFNTAGLIMRSYICERIPLSNGYETMLFLTECILITALLLCRKFKIIIAFGFLLSGFTLLVSELGQMNPQMTPLMPILHSQWLSLHVSLIMISYSLFFFLFFNALTSIVIYPVSKKKLIVKEQIEQMTLLSRVLLYPAIFLLGCGIFCGAVWANISWGRYWAWDPKETWALITFLLYSFALHTKSLKIFQKPIFFHLFMIFAFGCIIMTYFGVNYFLGGIHSYGN